MNSNSKVTPRGRPKTLNREHIIDVALNAYWQEGIGNISINEICKQAKISKPGLYREFGGEDGLMKAVLVEYQQRVLSPMLQIITEDQHFKESLESLVAFVTPVNNDQEAPRGCLLVKMREGHMKVGEKTKKQITFIQQNVLSIYYRWVEDAKAKGEFSADMSSQFVATYIDNQLSNALSQIALGEDSHVQKKILKLAFSMLG